MHHRSRLTRRSAALAVSVAAVPLLLTVAGCSRTASPSAAASATSPACTLALAKLPATVLSNARVPLDVAGAASWGDPPIVLRCGLPALGPTTTDCLTVNGVDWVVDASADPLVATTFGRAPAVELSVPASYGKENLSAALVDASPVAAALPTDGHACVG